MRTVTFLSLFIILSFAQNITAQSVGKNLIYVDSKGVIRYTKNNKEAAFFGVNYTVPFAYGYRSHKALSIDIEKAIDADIYHLSRLGLDAFRVHVWDVEISDSLGNLLENEHLRLFDYLIQKLKERGIKILITPIAFWGNGYPEPDIKTAGFSYVYGKPNAVVNEGAIKAQENYLKQFFTHVNPYTKLSYKDDPHVIAMEINNEPHHSGPKEKTTEYINRLTASVKSTGWSKPIFYNISESPSYADAVAKAAVDGHSFQWYPTGLVAGHEQKGNFLPNVDQYFIPFTETIPAFRNRAKAVYEFDAGDVMQPIMYPAMARSFRTAGFQWATQFAYDPMATAYANTEYQTHYLNLIYTPSKAISLLIASKAFHLLPRLKSYGAYPTDTLFDVFRVSYKNALSEMNGEEEFYYTNNTSTQPKNSNNLKHIVGVGSSPIVQYEGTGAYFLDKLSNDLWRLEVLPDALRINDPFEKASLQKTVTQVVCTDNKMKINVPGFSSFFIKGINEGNDYTATVANDILLIKPGTYLISKENIQTIPASVNKEFFAPAVTTSKPSVIHQPLQEVTTGKTFSITAKLIDVHATDKVLVEMHNSSNKWKTLNMQQVNHYEYKTDVPSEMTTPGVLNYRIILKKHNGDTYTFPGGFKGDPYAWDAFHNESWETFIPSREAPLVLFNATTDRTNLMLYNPDWRNNTVEYIASNQPSQLALKATMTKPTANALMGFQFFFGDKIKGRNSELLSFTKLAVRARSLQNEKLKLALITNDADAYSNTISLSKEWKDYEILLSSLKKDSFLLLPRPYPNFQPLLFTTANTNALHIADAEKIEFSFAATNTDPTSIEVEWVWLKK